MNARPSSGLPPLVRAAVLDLRARLHSRFGGRLQDIRVFGSYARGDWGPHSDVDVLVVVERLAERERREVFEIAEEVYFEHLIHLSPLAFSSDEYRDLHEREYRLASEIDADGVAP